MNYKITLLGVAALIFCQSAWSQSTFGSILGSAQDQSGAVVPGATIVVTNLGTNLARTVTSNEVGQYSVLDLPAGRYSLVARKEGFVETRINEIALDSREERRVDLTFSVGGGGVQRVAVEAAAIAVNTENGTISSDMNNQVVTQLPLNYRGSTTSPLAAIIAQPNVQQDASGQISVGGSLPYMTRYSIDGTNNNVVAPGADSLNGNLSQAQQDNYPSTEMLSEFKVSAVGNNAEFAGPGDITVITKSGANAVHGSAFEYLQNAALDATTYGSPTKQGKVWNTFGGSFSGPIVIPKLYDGRNKTFFFVDYEGNRKPGSTLAGPFIVPTPAERTGNLNGLTSGLGGAIVDPSTGNPFPNNTIPASELNSVAQNYFNLGYYPQQTTPGALYNYAKQVPTPQSTNGYDVRIDQNFGSRNLLFGRWGWKNIDQTILDGGANGNGLLPSSPITEQNRSLTIGDIFTITPTVINEFHFGYSRQHLLNDTFPLYGKAVANALGLQVPGLDTLPNLQGRGPFPQFNFSQGTGFATETEGTNVNPYNQVIQFTDSISWIKGRHTMKFGGEAWRDSFSGSFSYGGGDDLGTFDFTNYRFSGNALADFLLGLPSYGYVVTMPEKAAAYWAWRSSYYAQDQFQVTSRLTLNFGLRYAILPRLSEVNGQLTTFDPNLGPADTGTLIVPTGAKPLLPNYLYLINACPTPLEPGWAGVPGSTLPCEPIATGFGSNGFHTYHGNIQPRFSFAWRPFNDNKTVVRGGFGIYSFTPSGQTWGFSANTSTFLFYGNGVGCGGYCGAPSYVLPQSMATPLTPYSIGSNSMELANANLKDPRMSQWNLTIERELVSNLILRINYIGSATSGLPIGIDLNQTRPSTVPLTLDSNGNAVNRPYLNFAGMVYQDNLAFSHYEALSPSLEHRSRNGLFFQANFTWAKSIGNAAGDAPAAYANSFGGGVNDHFDLGADRGNDPGTRQLRFLLTAAYELPFGKGKPFLSNANRVVTGILGGWSLSTITLVESGPYLTPTIAPSYAQDNLNEVNRYFGGASRPDRIGNGNISNPTPNQWFDINAFALPPTNVGRIGNAGVGILEGPGTVAIAGGLSKVFFVTEKLKLRVEASFTNLPNHPNFAAPSTLVTNPSTFGVVTTTQTAENSGNRVGQLSARFDF